MLSSSQHQQCKLGTFLLKRKISHDPSSVQPPLRIAYRIIRPYLLTSEHAPLLLIHGGPSLASEYLNPIADECLLKDRCLIMYDQLGCGWSSIPQQDEWYGVQNMASDLDEFIQHLQNEHNLRRYHICGHSLGGAIGYEYLRKLGNGNTKNLPQCLSFVLSNASTNFKLSTSEKERLFDQFVKQMNASKEKGSQDLFFHCHICRTETIPDVLKLALSRRGKEWSANEYVALPIDRDLINVFPPVLIIRGEYDFVTESCTNGWDILIGKALQVVVLNDCAHYPHIEHPHEYSRELYRFCISNEN
jgi:proline iminopeptidase